MLFPPTIPQGLSADEILQQIYEKKLQTLIFLSSMQNNQQEIQTINHLQLLIDLILYFQRKYAFI